MGFYKGLRTLSQLNYTNAVQKWSFSKCGFSTCLASKIKGNKLKSKGNYLKSKVIILTKNYTGALLKAPRGA